MKAVLRIFSVVCIVTVIGEKQVMGQWTQTTLTNVEVTRLVISGENLYAGTNAGLFLSKNNGDSWNKIETSGTSFGGLAVSGNTIVRAHASWIKRSSDGGATWSVFTAPDSFSLRACAAIGNRFFVLSNRGIYYSPDNEANWRLIDTTMDALAAFVFDSSLYVSTADAPVKCGIFRSTDDGTNWMQVDSGWKHPYAVAFASLGSNLFAGVNWGGVYVTSNGGDKWIEVNDGMTAANVSALATSRTNVFSANDGYGIFMSTNYGTTWNALNNGLNDHSNTCLAANDTYLFAGAYRFSGGVWRVPLSAILSTDGGRSRLPENLDIHVAPNPFSNSTTFSYSLPSRSFVSLKIFDALGKEVSTLVSGDLNPGQHSYQWKAAGLRSGVYLCRLQAGSFVATQKLTVLR